MSLSEKAPLTLAMLSRLSVLIFLAVFACGSTLAQKRPESLPCAGGAGDTLVLGPEGVFCFSTAQSYSVIAVGVMWITDF